MRFDFTGGRLLGATVKEQGEETGPSAAERAHDGSLDIQVKAPDQYAATSVGCQVQGSWEVDGGRLVVCNH